MAGGVRRINLALQGGGAHGAFTWGVLDRLLEDETIEIAAISGTSAGAMNAAAMKAGMIDGGRDAARANLDWFWGEVASVGDLGLTRWLLGFWPMPDAVARFWAGAAFPLIETFTRTFSPYDLPMLQDNPMREIADRFRFDRVCADVEPLLYVAATNVRTGKIRVFSGHEISTDVLLASACLPTMFRAVEFIDPATDQREAFWDGGYTGNPALFPLFDLGLPADIVIVNINPLIRPDLPRSVLEIQSRINEISFNSSLLRELRAINFVRRLIAEGKVSPAAMKEVRIHMIADDDFMNELSVVTKTIAIPGLLDDLKAAGRRAADKFLVTHGDKVGVVPSVDLEMLYG